MLVRITECCRMECTHCMIEASPSGKHMPVDIFGKTLEFINRNGLAMLIISGGEPLEHPEFFKLIEMAIEAKIPVPPLILSNGMFLEDEGLRERVLSLGIGIQITNDARFYPKKIKEIEHPLISYEHHIRMLSPLGRAKNMSAEKKFPLCFNFRSVVRKLGFQDGIMYLRMNGKMCTPSVNVDGSISAGETNQCFRIGTVESTPEELTKNTIDMSCNRCGLEENLLEIHKKAIGK